MSTITDLQAYKKSLHKSNDYSQDEYIDAKIAQAITKPTEEEIWNKAYELDKAKGFPKAKRLYKKFTNKKLATDSKIPFEYFDEYEGDEVIIPQEDYITYGDK